MKISLRKELSSALLSIGKREVQIAVGSGQVVAGPNILKCCHGELAHIYTHTQALDDLDLWGLEGDSFMTRKEGGSEVSGRNTAGANADRTGEDSV